MPRGGGNLTNLLYSANQQTFLMLTHCGLMMPYGNKYMDQHDSGNGLLPDGTKPLPQPMLTYHR